MPRRQAGGEETTGKLEELEERAETNEARLTDVVAGKADAAHMEECLVGKCSPEDVRSIVNEAVAALREEMRAELAAGLEPKVLSWRPLTR